MSRPMPEYSKPSIHSDTLAKLAGAFQHQHPMDEPFNRNQVRDNLKKILHSIDATEPVFTDVTENTMPDKLLIYHTKVESRMKATKTEDFIKASGVLHNLADEVNKLITNLSSIDEQGEQTVTIHLGKLKTA